MVTIDASLDEHTGAAIIITTITNRSLATGMAYPLMVNPQTAKALRLTISRDFLLRADEVIE
jgi:hypothetical protein